MKNFTRAQLKKAHKMFKVGDLVTWENGFVVCRVLEVKDRGVIVDVQPDGKFPRYFVAYDGNIHRNRGGRYVRHPTPEDYETMARYARVMKGLT